MQPTIDLKQLQDLTAAGLEKQATAVEQEIEALLRARGLNEEEIQKELAQWCYLGVPPAIVLENLRAAARGVVYEGSPPDLTEKIVQSFLEHEAHQEAEAKRLIASLPKLLKNAASAGKSFAVVYSGTEGKGFTFLLPQRQRNWWPFKRQGPVIFSQNIAL